MPADSLETEELRIQATGRQHLGCIIPQAVTHSLVLLKMRGINARNVLSWLKLLINLYCCIQLMFISFMSNDAGQISNNYFYNHPYFILSSAVNFNEKLCGFFNTVEWFRHILIRIELNYWPKHVGDHNTIKVHK